MFYSIIKGEYKNMACAYAVVFYFLNEIAGTDSLVIVFFFFACRSLISEMNYMCFIMFGVPTTYTISYEIVLYYACKVENE